MPPTATTAASAVTPDADTLMVPSKAGAWVPVPAALSRPLTPEGSAGVDSPMRSPEVASSCFLAEASRWVGVAVGSSDPAPEPEQAASPAARQTRATTAVRRRSRARGGRVVLMGDSLARVVRLVAGSDRRDE